MIEVLNGDMLELVPLLKRKFNLIYYDPPQEDEYNRQDMHPYKPEYIKGCFDKMLEDSRILVFTNSKTRYQHETICRNQIPYSEEIIWTYEFGTYTRKRFVPSHNTILVYTRGQPPFLWEKVTVQSERQRSNDIRADGRGRVPGTVWQFARVPGNAGQRRILGVPIGKGRSTHPIELVKRFIFAYTRPGDWVLDPFAGSGVVLEVCKMYDRNAIGIEINPTFCQQILQRLSAAQDTYNLRRHLKVK